MKVKMMGERQLYFSSPAKRPINTDNHNLPAMLSNVAFFNHICCWELNFLALNTLCHEVFESQTDCFFSRWESPRCASRKCKAWPVFP